MKEADCLLIDCFGLLSSIYRYGEIAYIGGGFGVGIHNVLEAAVYGMPVISVRTTSGSVKLKACFNARVALKYKERRISRRLWTIS